MSDAVSTPYNEPETPETQPEVVWRVRHVLMQEPGYILGPCCHCGLNVFVTHDRMMVGDEYCHYWCECDRMQAQCCLSAHVRMALVLAKIAAKSE